MIGIVSTDKLLGTLRFEFAQVYMAPHAGLCDLDNRYRYIGAMVGHSLAVYQKIGQVNAKFRAAFAFAKSVDMLIPDLSSEIINNFFKRLNIHCKFSIIIRKRLYGKT